MNHPFTPEYIRMCKAAKEIQAMADANRGPGNFKDCNVSGLFVIPDWPEGEADQHENDTWLPRLDQLVALRMEITGGFEWYFEKSRDAHERMLEVYMLEAYEKGWDEREGKWD